MIQDLTNQRFGRLTVIKQNGKVKKLLKWDCVCDCGKAVNVFGGNLKRGNTKSCGCLGIESLKSRATHGMYGTQFYLTYYRIKARCNNPKYPEYRFYGGRGIKNKWKSFESFKEDMFDSFNLHVKEYGGKNTSIDRIDVNGSYRKENCRWATNSEQCRNKRNNILLTYNNKTQCLTDWAKEYNLSFGCLNKRLNKGWDIGRSLNTPPRTRFC